MSQYKFPYHTQDTQSYNNKQLLNWFQQYSVLNYSNLDESFLQLTPITIEIIDFLKPILKDFYPGSSIKPTTPNQLPHKNNFQQLLITLATKKPKFLINHIINNNSSITNLNSSNIPFSILLSTLQDILSKFTTTLFCKLNYKTLFNSRYFIPPYSIKKRFQIAINLARLHLYLHNKYQTIDYQKFFKDLNLKPIKLRTFFHIQYDSNNQLDFSIYNNSKFDINIFLNISTTKFLDSFYIPTFVLHLTKFDTWFKKFFKHYKKQFNNIDERKLSNYIKSQITTTINTTCRKLLPSNFKFPTIASISDRTKYSIKAALHHLLSCKDQITCNLTHQNTHNLHDLTTYYFKHSFKIAPSYKLYPNLDFSIFLSTKQYPASFNKPFPFKDLYDLADNAEKKFNEMNNTLPNPKQISFFFYIYLKAYLKFAAKNIQITSLNLKEALHKAISTPIDSQILARIIAYYDIIHLSKPTISQIKHNLQYSYLKQAEEFIIKKFKIKTPTIATNSFILTKIINKTANQNLILQPQNNQPIIQTGSLTKPVSIDTNLTTKIESTTISQNNQPIIQTNFSTKPAPTDTNLTTKIEPTNILQSQNTQTTDYTKPSTHQKLLNTKPQESYKIKTNIPIAKTNNTTAHSSNSKNLKHFSNYIKWTTYTENNITYYIPGEYDDALFMDTEIDFSPLEHY